MVGNEAATVSKRDDLLNRHEPQKVMFSTPRKEATPDEFGEALRRPGPYRGPCPLCAGTGVYRARPDIRCERCKGTGVIE